MDEQSAKAIIYLVKCLNCVEKRFFPRTQRKQAKAERAKVLTTKLGADNFNYIDQTPKD